MELLVVLLLAGSIAALWERRKRKRVSDNAHIHALTTCIVSFKIAAALSAPQAKEGERAMPAPRILQPLKYHSPVPRLAAVVTVMSLLLAVTTAGAQETSGCPSFQACLARAHIERWTQLAQVIEKSANNVAAVRKALDQARVSGDGARIASLESLLAQARADWQAKRQLAETLSGLDYRGYLLARAADLEQRLEQAQIAFQRKTDQFRRLNQALQTQNTKQVQEMRALTEDERRAARSLQWHSLLAGLDGAVTRGRRLLRGESPVNPMGPPQPRPTIDWPGLVPLVERLKAIDVGKEAWEGQYMVTAGKLGQLTLETLNNARKIGPMNTALAQVGAIAGVVEVGSGLISLAQVYAEFEVAQARQRNVLGIQQEYQFEVYRLGEVVKLARAERDRAREAISRQAVFEQQFKQASKQVLP